MEGDIKMGNLQCPASNIYIQVGNVECTVVSVHVRTVYSTVITTCRQFMVHGNKCTCM